MLVSVSTTKQHWLRLINSEAIPDPLKKSALTISFKSLEALKKKIWYDTTSLLIWCLFGLDQQGVLSSLTCPASCHLYHFNSAPPFTAGSGLAAAECAHRGGERDGPARHQDREEAPVSVQHVHHEPRRGGPHSRADSYADILLRFYYRQWARYTICCLWKYLSIFSKNKNRPSCAFSSEKVARSPSPTIDWLQ